MFNNETTKMKTQTEVKSETKTRYVITKDGLRMSYEEYKEMIESERY